LSTRTYRDSQLVDFAIVGSGAAGGVIARELARAGLSVVLLEQGLRYTPAQFEHDELKYWFLAGITNDAVKNPQTFRDDPAKKAEPALLKPPLWYARTVGGTTVHYTANYWRFHPIDFHERSVLGPIAGTGFDDWPISYEELEPYYTKVEWEIGVSGLAGSSPFDPPRTKPYPMPPMPVKSSGVLLERGARKLGPASVPGAACDQLHALWRALAVRALRLLSRDGVRGRGQGVVADDRDPRSRSDRPLRGASGELCRAHRNGCARPGERRRVLRQREA
jgi:choline dehydrogenase-like flavoprotein